MEKRKFGGCPIRQNDTHWWRCGAKPRCVCPVTEPTVHGGSGLFALGPSRIIGLIFSRCGLIHAVADPA